MGRPGRPGDPVALDLALACAIASDLEGHPDNASATIYGGMTLSWFADDAPDQQSAARTVQLPLHPSVTAVAFVPETTLATHTARALLPDRVPLRHAALNSARAALLVEAATRRPELLVPATRDWLHQEARRPSYPASMSLVDELRGQGHAAFISGAGPSVLVLTTADVADTVTTLPAAGRWQRLVPGIPQHGASVVAR
jgi:homoserine kinase